MSMADLPSRFRSCSSPRAIGLPFPGGILTQPAMLADVRLTEAPQEVLSVNGVREGFVFMAAFGDGGTA